VQTIQVEIDHRRGIERQYLADDQATDDGDTQRRAQAGVFVGADDISIVPSDATAGGGKNMLMSCCNYGCSTRCVVPKSSGLSYELLLEDDPWLRFFINAPRPRTPSEQKYSDRRIRSRR